MGRHSADFGDFGTTADLKSSSAPKSPKNYESPTAIPRILEEESQASKSLRGDTIAEAIHTNTQKLDSSIDSKETSAQPKRCPLFSKEATLCHATAGAVSRNNRNNTQAQKVDSRINATNLSKPAKDSRISKETAFCDDYALNDSKNCGGALRALGQFGGGSYLSGNDYPQIDPIASNCSPKAESPQTQIPLIDLHTQYHTLKPELHSAIASVLHSQHFILGEHSQALESELASFVGRRFCITCSSGTSALLLALLALGIGAGDEVITPSFSFIAAAEMVAFLGAKPVFVDICPSTYTLDPAQVSAKITPRTKAIIPVCLFGQPYDVSALNQVAGAIPIIEDGAQSFGSKILGEREARSGSFGTLSVTSFFPSKPLGGYGDGGAVFCDDEKLAQSLARLRNHGQASKYHHQSLGLNARLDELQCAILRVKLRHFTRELNLREQVAARYYALLKPLQSSLALPYTAPDRTSVFAQFCLRALDSSSKHLESKSPHLDSSLDSSVAKARDHITSVLNAQGIATAIHYPTPLHLQECFAYLGYKQGDFPVSERVSQEIFSIPFSPYLTKAAQKHIAKALYAIIA
ncbi:DegT/DnrJ/EryC1/StrS family aminotransferase [Helicobacter canis]|uniref:DegT/DnrJ/EryC1/StrS family aminotransferase n=1 Tax=Helicobacter canis TaxID=29419 RepID=UPI001FE48600|nr:DegT/DnrJ/EryC1/StrS family aminotransferase [Helicobacter canis]